MPSLSSSAAPCVLLQYVSQVDNLCLMMDLLRDESRSIQFEAFHVFKVTFLTWLWCHRLSCRRGGKGG